MGYKADAALEATPLLEKQTAALFKARHPRQTRRRTASLLLCLSISILALISLLPLAAFPLHSYTADPNETIYQRLFKHTLFSWQHSNFGQDELKKILIETPKVEKLAEWSKYYTAGPHLAGRNLSQAEWTRDLWKSFGIESHIVSYDVYLNYPVSSRLALLYRKGEDAPSVQYECSLKEDTLVEDPTTSLPNRVPVFHGYSASGNVTAQYVYVNFGTIDDFKDLVAADVPLVGKIALAKYGRNFRGIKVQLAEKYGMAGVIMYDDPQQDGDITEENGYKHYPDGPARNPSAVQRGSVQYLSTAPGDPTTIGYPSKPGAPRTSPNGTTPQIPSLPISYTDAIPLLRALNGHGLSSKKFSKFWQGGGLGRHGVEYNIGPSPPELRLNLVNNVEYTITPIWNVVGVINGTKTPEQSVIVGNHRDAWIAGGAGDPNSGSAALNEVVRSYGEALDAGWQSSRSLIFLSVDGEEYGLLGSTEFVEEYLPWLNAEAVSYLNVDVATSGPVFRASASPLVNHVLSAAAASVLSPNQTVEGQTIYDVWRAESGAHISTLGSGSDYTAFMDFAGISSVNLGFVPRTNSAIYHYHSNYDSFHWMSKYGDPSFKYHLACAQLLSILAASMVETPVIPYIASDYADSLITYIKKAESQLNESAYFLGDEGVTSGFEKLHDAAERVKEAAVKLDQRAESLMEQITNAPFWWRWLHGRILRRQVKKVNEALKLFERSFIFPGGLDGRTWYKHVVFAPGKYTGYAGATLPGIVESIAEQDRAGLCRWQKIVAGTLVKAQRALSDGL